MWFTFILLNCSLLTVALGCGSAEEIILSVVCLVGCVLAQGLWPLLFDNDVCSGDKTPKEGKESNIS